MASKARWQVAWLPEALRGRATLLSRTALGTVATLLVATPTRAQPAANARPSGGIVTAGSASIGTSASATTITQTSQRTAINWQSFNVGSQQIVDFIQPSSSSVALNRVISANPSQIAGHIDANGQIILINQSGVIFDQGAQVNTAGLIVSAAGMSNVNFMAGKLVFDEAAYPNAAVVNQGSLTVRQAGLAALVAPQVANSGVITAKLGHVVLAGAKTATLDLYGDGLVSLDMNNQVTQAPIGPGGAPVTALVTNTGVIQADGGTVQLTAREADGLVQNLVQAGGKISADSVGSKTGAVVLGGLGGSIVLSGVVTADGAAPGTTGGQVQVDASRGVTLAAGARVSASGPAGGGTVAIGTTLARAAGGPGTVSSLTARTVQVAQGASIAANATADGDGGRVTVLSSLSTSMSGNIYALGGPRGGNGGFIETSGEWLGIGAGAVIDARALSATGKPGTWLLDPLTLDVVAGSMDTAVNKTAGPPFTVTPNNTPPGTAAKISNGTIDGELNSGTNVVLTTTSTGTGSGEIRVDPGAGITWTSGATLTMNSVGAIIIDAPITNTTNAAAALILNAAGVVGQDPTNGAISLGNLAITSVGAVTLLAPNSVATLAGSVTESGNSFQFNNTAAALTVGTNVGGSIISGITTLNGAIDLTTTGSGAITLTGSVNAGSAAVALTSAGAITESGGAIVAGTLTGSAVGAATLSNTGNAIANLGPFSSVENFTLNDTPTGATPTLTVVGTVLASAGVAPSVLNLTVAGNLVIGPATGTPAGLSGGAVDLVTTANGVATGTISETALGSVTASTLTGSAAASVSLPQQNNLVGALAGFTSGSGFVLATAQPLTVTSAVDAGTGALSLASTGGITVNANLTTSGAEIDLASAFGFTFTNNAAIASGGGNIVVIADNMSLSGAGASINAGSGVVVLGPAFPTLDVVLGAASTPDTLGLQTTDLATIAAGMVQIGYAAENGTPSFTGAISIGGTGGISINPATIPALLLLTGGSVSQTQPLVFSAAGGTLGVIAGGNVILGGVGNAVDTIAGFAGNSGNFAFVNGQALTVGSMPAQQLGVSVNTFGNGLASSAPLATGTGLPSNKLTGVTTFGVTGGGLTPTPGVIVLQTTAGDLALDAPVNANNGSTSLVATPNLVGLQAFGNITQTAAGVISAVGVEALAGGSVTLDVAPNQIGGVLANGQPGGVAGTSTGSFALLDSGHVLETNILAVSAGVTLTIATGVVTSDADINLASAGLVLNQPLNAGGGTVRLVESGAVSQQSAGIITAGSLSVTDSAGPVVLEAVNAVGTVAASLTSGGSAFTFSDAGTLLTLGSVAAAPLAEDPNSAFGAVSGVATNGGDINLLSSGLAVNAAVGAGAGTVRLLEFGAVSQAPGSPITAGALSVTDSGGQVVLETANAIGTLAVNVTFAGGALSFSNGTTAVTDGSIVAAGSGVDPGGVFHAVTGLTTSDADINLLSGGLTLSNAVNAGAGTVRLLESGAVSQAAGGVITAGSLAVTDSGGPVVLEAANAVDMVAANMTFAGGAFSFNDPATALIIGSVVGAPGGEDPAILFASTVTGASTRNGDINLASKGLALNEAVGAGSGTVRLVDSGRLSQLTTGGITAGSLAVTLGDGSAGLGATNAIGTVAANLTFTHGAFSLNDGTTALTVASVAAASGGPGSEDPLGLFPAVVGVTTKAGNIVLEAAGITLNEAVSAGTADVTLTSAGAISQGASGAITAADLDAETELDAGGSISLTSAGNEVGTATLTSLNGAGNALSSGAIAFVDGVALTIADLSVLQTGVATIGAVQLADSGTGIKVEAGAAVTGSSVEIGVSAANGLFTNDGAVDATVSGVAPVGDVVILANTMSLAGGTISAPDAVVLGPFTTNVRVTLGGGGGGTLSLQANDIASITAGLLQIGYAGLTGDIAIAGALSLSAPQVPALALVTGGKIGEAGGVGVSFAGTGSLALVAGGSVAMQGGNQVSTLAGSAGGLGQSFVFNNLNLPLTVGTFPLALVGVAPDGNNFPVASAGATPSGVVTANGNITLATATSGDLVLDAPVNAGIGTVALDSVGAITQSAGGIVTAGTLTMSSTGGATLGDTNKVAALGTSTDTSATGITLVDGEALTVVGTVTAANSATLTLTTTTGALAIGAAGKVGVLNAGTVALTAAGGISEPNGSVVAGTLTAATTGAGDVSLGSATNQIGTDAGISVNSGDLVLVDNVNLTLTGNQSANNLFFEVNAGGGALQLGSNFVGATLSAAAGSGARISLVADNITEGFAPSSIATTGGTGGSGSVEVAPFTGSRAVSLAGATGGDEVIDAGLIGIITTGTVNVGRYTAVPAGGGLVISAQSIVVAGSFDLTGHAVALGLYSQFGISEPAGEIVVGTLTGSVGEGGAALSANNLVGTLGPFSSFSGFALTDNEALTVVGPVTDSGTGAGVSLTTTTGGITLAGAINAAGDTLTLISAGSIVQTGGSIDVATLSGSAVGSASLTAAGNLVGAVGGFVTAAGLVLIDNEALTVSGPISDSGVGQTVALTTTTGGITLSGVISAAGDTLDLVSAGAIVQSGGSINVGTLTGSAVGSAGLTAAANLVGTLGAFSSAGGFSLTVNQALLVNGPVTDSGTGRTVALRTGTGDLTLAGVISAPRDTLDLVSAGAISQTGGSIDVATLTGSAVGSASLTQAGDLVGTLAAFGTGSGLTLIDNQALTVSGPVSDSGTGGLVELVTETGGITLTGAVNAGGDTFELVSAGSINQTGGAIDVATLTGSAVGSASLTQTGNLVGTLASFSTGGGFALVDNAALTVSGPVTDSGTGQTVALTTETGGITLDGAIGAAGDTLALVSAGAIVQPGGSIDVAMLRGSAVGSASLTQAANVVVTLGSFSTGAGFALVDGQSLVVNGPVTDSGTGQTVALTTEAGGITLAGAINAGGDTLDLVSAGSIAQTGGSIVVATLTGSAVGSASFAQSTNLVGTLGGFSTSAGFALISNEALTVSGPVTDSGTGETMALTTKAGGLTLAGVIDAGGDTLALVSAGSITQPGGSIDVGILSVTAAGSATLTQAGNLVGALGAISTGGGFTLVNNQGLTVGGVVTDTGTGQTLVLTAGAGGITLNSSIDAPGDTLDLISGGAISQIGGSIQVASLTGSAVGSASLTQAGNLVGALGPFTTTAGFALVDNRAMVVNGPLNDSGIGQTVALTTTAGGLTLGGAVNAGGDTLDVVSAGAITQTGGSIDVATLTGSALGSASLTQATNLVGTLSGFSVSGNFGLTDNAALLVTGPLTSSGLAVGLVTKTGGITLSGVIDAPAATLDLVSAGSISQSGGSIDVAVLTGSAATSASFTQAANLVGALGAFSTTTGFALTDNEALTVSGVVSDSGTGQMTLTTETGGITLSGVINAANDTLSLNSAGAIIQTGGSIDVDTLTSSGATSASLTQPTNLVGTLDGFSTKTGFTLVDNETLLILASLSDTGTGQTVALTTRTGGITLNAPIIASGDTVNLISAGAISQNNGGWIDAATLTGSAVTSASLTVGNNAIGTLASFSTGSGFALTDNQALTVSGTLSDTGTGQTVALTTGPQTTTGGITLTGSINAPGDTLQLISGGAISQPGGSIDVATLTGSAATSASLTQGTNRVGTLDAFSTTAGFALIDSQALVVNGTVSDTGSGQTVELASPVGSIVLNGVINAAGDTLDLASDGSITQTGGSINVATLTGSVGSVSLTQAGNLVGTLGAFTTGAGFALVDNEALTVAGPMGATGTGQTVSLTTEVGGISLLGAILAPNDTLNLISAGSINQGPGGQIEVATLTGSAATSVNLAMASNEIGALGVFNTTAGFALNDNDSLVVKGAITDTGSSQAVALTTNGGITLAAPINAINDTLDLVTNGGITQTGGSIDVAVLAGSASGPVVLTRAGNLVGTLATFSSGGGFALVDNQALVVTGPLSDGGNRATVALTTEVGDITLAGAVNAGGDTLALVSAGAIAQTGGSIDVATLTGSAATSASLTQAANVVGTLGAFTTTAGFALVDNAALKVTGPLTDTGVGQTVALTTTSGGITLAGNINATNDTIDLVSAASITQTGGVIDPVTLTGSAVGSVSLLQPGNLISTLSTFTAGTSFELADSEGLTLTGILTAPLIFIDMPGNPLTMAAGAVLITGGTPPPNQLSITAAQIPPIPPPANGVGAYFKSGTFTQLGTDSVTPIAGSANSILFVDVTNGENISFAGLTAPTTWLILGLNARGSKVTGKVDVKSLTVTLPPNSVPSDFSVTLTGTVNGVSGLEAAQESGVIPTKGATLQFNSCPIGTVGCVVLSGPPVPTGSPVQFLTLGILVAPNDEGDLLLPLVSDEDYLSCLLRKDCE